jgi:CPA2 family monovalent cation:H+ antiporter-2
MEASPVLFRDLTYIFLAAVLGGLVAWRLKLPLILGFVLGGIAISPFTPGVQISDLHAFEVFAEVGVVLLMFSIGVEFSLKDLLKVKWVAAIGGPLGIALSIGLAHLVGTPLGWSSAQGYIIGAAISVASTMVLARFLTDRKALGTTWGSVTIGITLVEDLAVVLMTVLIPSFAGPSEGQWTRVSWVMGKALVLLVPLGFLALKVIPIVLRWIGKTADEELMLLGAVAVCLGTAGLAHAVGFSLALGAFLAGLAVSGATDLHHAHERIIPLRDAFVALFFVSLGTLIEPQVLRHNLPLLAAIVGLIILGKFVIWMIVVTVFRYPIRTALAAAAGLTQIGELSFVVVRAAQSVNMVGDDVFNAILAASLISIFLNVFIVRVAWKGLGSANNSDFAHAAA